ncbi:MAG: TfoX/Sxy family protein [Acidimicrobiales bacterium]
MSSDAAFIDRVVQRMAPLDVTAKPMFGEYGLYFNGKNFALVCDNTLYIKATEAGLDVAGRPTLDAPYPGAKLALRISAAKLNDRDWLVNLVQVTATALPAPKPKKRPAL